jgi:dihydroorotase
MNDRPILIQGGRIIDPDRQMDQIGDLLIIDGKIQQCGGTVQEMPPTTHVINANGWVISPGFIDLHCHLREPGYEYKETIATGTKAAARGGFTLVCCMPNTNPPLDCGTTVEFVLKRARETGYVRVAPIGCVTRGRKGKELANLIELKEAGVVGYSDDGNPVANSHLMRSALIYLLGKDLPIIDHCEDLSLTNEGVMHEAWVASRLGLRGSPAAAEESMIARDIALAEFTGGRLHVAHVTTANGVELIRRAKENGLDVTAEVTPHHLTMTHECVMGSSRNGLEDSLSIDAYDTRAKVNPPLRTQDDATALLQGLREGVIDAIATDHAPHALTDKQVTFDEAAMGISGLETTLGSLLNLVHTGNLDLMTLVQRLTKGPSSVLGGRFDHLATLQRGTPADVVAFAPHEEWTVDARQFASKGQNTPLDGQTLKGTVKLTLVEGHFAYTGDDLELLKW